MNLLSIKRPIIVVRHAHLFVEVIDSFRLASRAGETVMRLVEFESKVWSAP